MTSSEPVHNDVVQTDPDPVDAPPPVGHGDDGSGDSSSDVSQEVEPSP